MKNFLIYTSIILLFFSCQNDRQKSIQKINLLQKKLVDNDLKTNKDVAKKISFEMEDYILNYKNDSLNANYILLLADLNTNVFNLPIKGFYYYEKFFNEYPLHKKAPLSLFYQAYVLENYLKKNKESKLLYEKFLVLYPDHELANTVRFSIKNLGIPLEDLVKEFENIN